MLTLITFTGGLQASGGTAPSAARANLNRSVNLTQEQVRHRGEARVAKAEVGGATRWEDQSGGGFRLR